MESSDARILRGAAIPTALAGLIAVVVSLLVAGGTGAIGAALGVIVVLAFFTISVLVVSRISQQFLMQAAMFSYVVKLVALFGLVVAVKNVTFMNPKAFAWTVIALTVTWIMAETRASVSIKQTYVVPAREPARDPGSRTEGTMDRSS